jgi:hypothetical protein
MVLFAGLQQVQYRPKGLDSFSDRGRPSVKAVSTTIPGMEMSLTRTGADSLTLLLDRRPSGGGKMQEG